MKLFSWYVRSQLPSDIAAALVGLLVGVLFVEWMWGKL